MNQKNVKIGSTVWPEEVSKILGHKKKEKIKNQATVIFHPRARMLPLGRLL